MKYSLSDKFKIEYSAVMPLSLCEVTKPRLLERENIGSDGSVLLFLIPYYTDEAFGGNLSVYASGRDYHAVFAEIAANIIGDLRALVPDAKFLGYIDHAPINEKKAAAMAGLGVIGENSLLINEKYSSFVFIGGIYSDIPADAWKKILSGETKFPTDHRIDRCVQCGACIKACPGGAILGDGRIDPEKCLSAISQKKKLTINEEKKLAAAPYLWGCDICQLVCPMTQNAIKNESIKTPLADFREGIIPLINDEILDGILDSGRFSDRAYSWRGEEVIRRNIRLQKEKRYED